ncbi:DUF1566 domain-containing protein [Treponema bryantii]|uniref:DUF1566 domain-containing protein n=1 Tax=Treponema bryantii TaxID=163 RepID=UPI0003B5D423|nr:DUF1566 domain-containing protein [Treponema bryantii]
MKKIVILLLASVFIFASCSNGNNTSDEPAEAPVTSETGTEQTGSTGSEQNGSGGTGSTEQNDSGEAENSGNETGGDNTSTVTYIGTKAPDVAKEVGDIVFNDGSAMAYADFAALDDDDAKTAKKAAAIALIFYKGTGLNSDAADGTPDTTTSRTLGVGLKHNRSGLAWCWWTINSDYANAYSKNITTIQCPHDESAGALTFTGDKDGSNNLEQIKTFLSAEGSGTTDDTGTAANYPAFYFAKNYSTTATNLGTAYASGWYLPSIAELFQIYANGKGTNKVFDIDAASYALGGNKFVSWYWSSSQSSYYDNACLLDFNSGDWKRYGKNFNYGYVCAVRAFN